MKDPLKHAVRIEEWRGARIGVVHRQDAGLAPALQVGGQVVAEPRLPTIETLWETWLGAVDARAMAGLVLQNDAQGKVRAVENEAFTELREEPATCCTAP